MNNSIILLSDGEHTLRLSKIRQEMSLKGIPAILITDNANTYYLTGRVFTGYIYIPLQGPAIYFVRRPSGLKGDGVVYLRKPEEMAQSIGLSMPESIGLELDVTTWSVVDRLSKVFTGAAVTNASPLMRKIRSVKTPYELSLLKLSGEKHDRVYRRIPHLYQPGMTDIELQVEIERVSRLEGCLGQFRISGDSMELYMGNVLVGGNADTPTPYDFAMGGEGLDPSLPVGCNGSMIEPGNTVMVDMNGNFTGYMTDMTRVFSLGDIAPLAVKAHRCSIRICREIATTARPGTEAKALFELAEKIVREEDLTDYFMGHHQKAAFIGHGVGIEINELPVIAPRSRDVLVENNVIALEPKFVIPHTGAVGIENTYVVKPGGLECLTHSPEEIISFQ